MMMWLDEQDGYIHTYKETRPYTYVYIRTSTQPSCVAPRVTSKPARRMAAATLASTTSSSPSEEEEGRMATGNSQCPCPPLSPAAAAGRRMRPCWTKGRSRAARALPRSALCVTFVL